MPRLCFRVEGQTEQTFARNVLAPHLAQYDVIVTEILQTALARKRGRIHRGGVGRYEPLKNDIHRMLKADQNTDVYFTTMIDVYALPKTFPGYWEAAAKNDPYKRVALLESAFEEDIGDQRFIPYIQLHEFEALLLTDPAEIGGSFPDRDRKVVALTRLCDRFGSPEEIDDGPQTCPSKRIAAEIPEYLQTKASAGPAIAARIGLENLRGKCPHFAEWLTKLKRLGGLNVTE